jgi:hypothetical protein
MRRTESLSYTTRASCVIFPASVLLQSIKKQFMFTKRRRKVFMIWSRKRFSTSRCASTNRLIANATLVQCDHKYDTDPEQTHSNARLWTGSEPTQLNMQIYQYSQRCFHFRGTVDHVQCCNTVNWIKCVQSVNIWSLINLVQVKANTLPRVWKLLHHSHIGKSIDKLLLSRNIPRPMWQLCCKKKAHRMESQNRMYFSLLPSQSSTSTDTILYSPSIAPPEEPARIRITGVAILWNRSKLAEHIKLK